MAVAGFISSHEYGYYSDGSRENSRSSTDTASSVESSPPAGSQHVISHDRESDQGMLINLQFAGTCYAHEGVSSGDRF